MNPKSIVTNSAIKVSALAQAVCRGKSMASVGVAGVAAIMMEVRHPSVMHGVFSQYSYRTAPHTRSLNTLG